jgi:hypothetical protein
VDSPGWYSLLKEMLDLLYLKSSGMLRIVYQFVPLLLRLFIEGKDHKNTGMFMCEVGLERVVAVMQSE